MKNLCLLVIMSVLAFSCGSTKVNELKLSMVEKVQSKLQSALESEFLKSDYSGMDCQYEGSNLAEKVGEQLSKLLKVKEEGLKVSKSVVGDAVKLGCVFGLKKAFPLAISKLGNLHTYKCSSKFLIVGADKLADKVCSGIK